MLQADELYLKSVIKDAEDLKKEQFKRSQRWGARALCLMDMHHLEGCPTCTALVRDNLASPPSANSSPHLMAGRD